MLAGYPDDMDRLLGRNPGLKSRVADVIEFPDFTPRTAAELAALQTAAPPPISNEIIRKL